MTDVGFQPWKDLSNATVEPLAIVSSSGKQTTSREKDPKFSELGLCTSGATQVPTSMDMQQLLVDKAGLFWNDPTNFYYGMDQDEFGYLHS